MKIIEISESKHHKLKDYVRRVKEFLCEMEECLEESAMNYRDEEEDDYYMGYRGGRGRDEMDYRRGRSRSGGRY